MRIYEMAENYEQIMDMLENGEVEFEQIADTLEALDESISEKMQNVVHMLVNLDSNIVACKAEEDRLNHRRRMMENKQQRIKEWAKSLLIQHDRLRIKYPTFTIAVQNNNPSVEVDEKTLPYQYWIERTEKKPDRKKLAELLKAGQTIEGAKLVTTNSLRIR